MNRRLYHEEPPEIPLSLRDADLVALIGWLRERLYPYLKRITFSVIEQLNTQVQEVGPKLTVMGANQTLKVAFPGVPLDGAGSIKIIQPPVVQVGVQSDQITPRMVTAFTGPIFVMPALTAAWTLVTGGNIAKASAAVPGQLMTLYFDGSLWWPSY